MQRKTFFRELAGRLSHLLQGSVPDKDLISAIENGQLDAVIDALLEADRGKLALKAFVSQWLLIPEARVSNNIPVDQCNLTQECAVQYPGYTAYDCKESYSKQSWCSCDGQSCAELNPSFEEILNHSVKESHALIDYVVNDEEAPFWELFSADYSFLNSKLANTMDCHMNSMDGKKLSFRKTIQEGEYYPI